MLLCSWCVVLCSAAIFRFRFTRPDRVDDFFQTSMPCFFHLAAVPSSGFHATCTLAASAILVWFLEIQKGLLHPRRATQTTRLHPASVSVSQSATLPRFRPSESTCTIHQLMSTLNLCHKPAHHDVRLIVDRMYSGCCTGAPVKQKLARSCCSLLGQVIPQFDCKVCGIKGD